MRGRTTLALTSAFPESMLYGYGWRARWRRWRKKTLPIHIVIDRGQPNEEQVTIVGVGCQHEGHHEFVVKRG